MRKKLFGILLTALLLTFGLITTANAESPITVSVDGTNIQFADQSPELINGKTYVPVRGVFEQMGGNVSYDAPSHTVTIIINNVKLDFKTIADTVTITKNSKTSSVELDGRTYVKNGRTMVPLRFISESLGYDVKWQADNRSVIIKSTSAKAISLINSFATGDTTVAENLLTETYIQHNLNYGTGRQAFVDAVKGLAAAPTKTIVKNVRTITDGDFVVLQNVYNFAGAGDQVAFDVFRFENGKIAEHWDNIASLVVANPSRHTQIDGAMTISDMDKTEVNKVIVNQFIKDVLMGQNGGALTSYFDGNNYIQHNKNIADGLDGLGNALAAWAKQGITMQYSKTHLLLGEGNFVFAASEGTLAGEQTAFFDLWRVENGKIAEHWDIISTIPDQSTWANDNGKF